MRFHPTELEGVTLIEREPRRDDRGSFARAFCGSELREAGLAHHVAQANLSFNHARGTLRGLHFQVHPHGEAKTVLVARGAIFDVAVDVRPGSPTFLRWTAAELTADNDRALHLPAGFAHGFLTLADDTLVQYFVSTPYAPGAERTVRWDDPRVGIRWPFAPTLVSPKDQAAPLLDDGPPAWPPFEDPA
ncbi:MAG: dTDP-4-dehydrorhamnose 3,5-epimerase [Sandaracinaceae bacterium]|nr:dTDP-4-dehydrorhamnose 3,5-epimerase [Sandaracinaceae bacterium]